MLRKLKAMWRNPEREARKLARDARFVIDGVVAHYPSGQSSAVARTVVDTLAEARPVIESNPARRPSVLGEIQSRHRAARQRNDQPGLSGLTLSLICLHADALGEDGDAARKVVDEFLDRWRHVSESTNACSSDRRPAS